MDARLADIFQRCAKLKNLADRAGTPEEAAVAATKLQELLLRYNLDMQSVENATPKDDYVQEDFLIHENRNNKTWAFSLYNGIARAHQCEGIERYTKKGETPKMTIIGRKHNIQVVNYLYAYLHGEIKRLSDQTNRDSVYRRAFCIGAVNVVLGRIFDMMEDVKQESSSNTALMVIEEINIQNKMKAAFPHMSCSKKSTSIGSMEGLQAGRKAGATIQIHRGVSGQSQKQIGG